MGSSFQKILDEFQITINDEIKHIKDFLENREEYKGKIFRKPEVYKCGNLQQFSEAVPKEGVYIFRVLNTKAIDPDAFNKVDYSSKLRNRKTISIDAKKTFYLGKSQNLYKRLNEHLFNSSKTTYSLKMNDENRSDYMEDLEVIIFELPSDYKNHDLIILGSVETILHKDEVPYVGSARV